MTCTLDPRFAALLFDMLPAIASSPALILIAWLFWRGTKGWRGREAMGHSRMGKVRWDVIVWTSIPSLTYFLAALLALVVWLYTALWR